MIFCRIHLGLGDHIATAAIINKLANESGEEIILPCYQHNEENVRSIFINTPNIIIHVVESDKDFLNEGKSFALGYYSPIQQLPTEDFVQWFYRQAGMTYADRLKWCPVQEAAKKVSQTTVSSEFEYDFVHDAGSTGEHTIKHKKDRLIFRPSKQGSILRYVEALKNATEIHCIDSSFFHLVESIYTKGQLFYHKTRPNSTKFNPIKQWTIIS
jgi:hypothetical protein